VQPARRRRLHRRLAETRKKFWLDRSRTAAISRHTNAFKVNEDVVIPLPRMGDYCDGIERINIELSTQNKLALCDALAEFLQGRTAAARGRRQPRQGRADRRPPPGRARLRRRRAPRWQWLLDNLDLPLAEAAPQFADYGVAAGAVQPRRQPALFHRLQDYSVRVSWKTELKRARQDLRRRVFRRCSRASRHPQGSAARPRLRRAAHARRRRQRAHQHPGQLRQLRDAADRQPRGRAHHGAGPKRSTA
jgi:FAD/FMN-containing dehydrogenase